MKKVFYLSIACMPSFAMLPLNTALASGAGYVCDAHQDVGQFFDVSSNNVMISGGCITTHNGKKLFYIKNSDNFSIVFHNDELLRNQVRNKVALLRKNGRHSDSDAVIDRMTNVYMTEDFSIEYRSVIGSNNEIKYPGKYLSHNQNYWLETECKEGDSSIKRYKVQPVFLDANDHQNESYGLNLRSFDVLVDCRS